MVIRLAPLLLIAILLLPVIAGVAGTLLPALGLMPAVGEAQPGLASFATLAEVPGLWRAALLSLGTGLAASLLALAIAASVMASFVDTAAFAIVRRLLAPLLAVPHAAAAFGIAALIAPSGLLMRLLSPWATGFERPPDLLIVNDPWGLALVLGLAAKEAPFLLLMLIAALPQAETTRRILVARTLGYRPQAAFLLAAWPALYRQIRLAVLAVVVYGVSTADMALILGPTTPPTLSVLVLRLATEADLALRPAAAAGALMQLAIALLACIVWIGVETSAARAVAQLARSGRRVALPRPLERSIGALAAVLPLFLVGGGVAALALWSVAGRWTFPAVVPDGLSLTAWRSTLPSLAGALGNSITLALASAASALLLVVLSLENEERTERRPGPAALAVLYAPLLVPQIAFVFGLSILFLPTALDATLAGVLVAHLVFVCPYVYLSLVGPWRALDERYAILARTLGARPWRVLVQVRLPLLAAPLLTAFALGFSVSIALYLPTQIIGAGRVPTVTTEAVALAAGLDRRIIGVTALMQALLPGLAFALALAVGRLAKAGRGHSTSTGSAAP